MGLPQDGGSVSNVCRPRYFASMGWELFHFLASKGCRYSAKSKLNYKLQGRGDQYDKTLTQHRFLRHVLFIQTEWHTTLTMYSHNYLACQYSTEVLTHRGQVEYMWESIMWPTIDIMICFPLPANSREHQVTSEMLTLTNNTVCRLYQRDLIEQFVIIRQIPVYHSWCPIFSYGYLRINSISPMSCLLYRIQLCTVRLCNVPSAEDNDGTLFGFSQEQLIKYLDWRALTINSNNYRRNWNTVHQRKGSFYDLVLGLLYFHVS